MKTSESVRRRARVIVRRLARMYPDAKCALDYGNPLQLLIATILSAQCTDARVNMVTPALFARYRSARDYAEADPRELESRIQSTGFFRSKTKSIMAACRTIVDKHGGKVPGSLEELVALPGVGRKTANVVLGNAFGVPGITVDTHVGRVSRRLGLTKHNDADQVEQVEVGMTRSQVRFLLGTPMVIVYKESPINWHTLGRLIQIENYGLVNLVAGRKVVTELMQNDLNGERLASELIELLKPLRNQTIKAELRSVSEELGEPGASQRAAERIVDYLGFSKSG